MESIKQLLPAVGWHSVTLIQDQEKKIYFDYVPLLGWGLLSDGEIVPLIWTDDEGAINPKDDEWSPDHVVRILAPGNELTDEIKHDLTERLREREQFEKRKIELRSRTTLVAS
jgi:hypothetical protein